MGPDTELHVHCQANLTDDELSDLTAALPELAAMVCQRWPQSVLGALSELEVSLVDDETLAGIHGEFLDDPTATDVITFPHGEILISTEMALQRAGDYGKSTFGETLLYLVHGLLHLAGFDDRESQERAEMARLQEEIWAEWMGRSRELR
ncbi:MAG: rRNA maturation RNase YbeY [Verrucomicrobiota bacterium JB023]|nr:rRNA maturation RNase YbeY [Verrucomicrobiota bacterium JB023]